MRTAIIATLLLTAASSFVAGAASYRFWWLSSIPGATLGTGEMSAKGYDLPSGVSSIEVRIFDDAGVGNSLKRNCLTIPGEKGRNGGGDAGGGIFCGNSVAILPGRGATGPGVKPVVDKAPLPGAGGKP